MDKLERFLSDVDGLWKKMMVELHSIGNTSNQVLNFWKIYSANSPALLNWLDNAENAIKKDTDFQLVSYA